MSLADDLQAASGMLARLAATGALVDVDCRAIELAVSNLETALTHNDNGAGHAVRRHVERAASAVEQAFRKIDEGGTSPESEARREVTFLIIRALDGTGAGT